MEHLDVQNGVKPSLNQTQGSANGKYVALFSSWSACTKEIEKETVYGHEEQEHHHS